MTKFETNPTGVNITFTAPPNITFYNWGGEQFYPGDDLEACPDETSSRCWRKAREEAGQSNIKYREYAGLWKLQWTDL